MSTASPLELYQQRIVANALKADPQQAAVVTTLDTLYQQILLAKASDGKFCLWPFKPSRKAKNLQQTQGLYIYGSVGRGKSMLMDLFYQTLPVTIQKQRVHFHAFMLSLHAWLHAARSAKRAGRRTSKHADDLLLEFAAQLASHIRVLCFDEFHVTDVADAMLLGRLFQALWDHDVITVATSNWAPQDLYKDGLQRELFLPFIVSLQKHLRVINLDSPTDYRLNRLRGIPVYYYPLGPATNERLQHAWDDLTEHAPPEPYVLSLAGRSWLIPRTAHGVAWLTFADACFDTRGAADYLALAKEFRVVIISDIPLLGENLRNETKRFITLIDALYEAHTKCIFGAEATPEQLVSGTSHAFEFTRTTSRLQEMQSALYLAKDKADSHGT